MEQHDRFVSIINGSDSIANYAIGIHNQWVFDANKRIAIPLCQEELDYCVSTKDAKNKFVSFTRGFFFWGNSNNRKLKEKAEGDNQLESTMTKDQR